MSSEPSMGVVRNNAGGLFPEIHEKTTIEMKHKHYSKPIESKEEASQVREWLVSETVRVAKVSREEAAKRMDDLFKSGELSGYLPTNPMFQLIVDKYMLNRHRTNEN